MKKAEELRRKVEELQKKATAPTEKMVGNHLLDIVGTNEAWAVIVLEDFAAGKTLADLSKAVEKAATRSGKCAVCGPLESTRAICKALGLPEPDTAAFLCDGQKAADASAEAQESEIDFLALLEV